MQHFSLAEQLMEGEGSAFLKSRSLSNSQILPAAASIACFIWLL